MQVIAATTSLPDVADAIRDAVRDAGLRPSSVDAYIPGRPALWIFVCASVNAFARAVAELGRSAGPADDALMVFPREMAPTEVKFVKKRSAKPSNRYHSIHCVFGADRATIASAIRGFEGD